MEEKQEKSQVWLVNLESLGLEKNRGRKYSKQLLSEYVPGQKHGAVLFPVGYVLKHPAGQSSIREDFGGFSKDIDTIPRAIYDNVDLSHLEGELLTVVDAAFTDRNQCEAIKSLVRNTIWRFNATQERRLLEIYKAA
jgi:hypothetical protein